MTVKLQRVYQKLLTSLRISRELVEMLEERGVDVGTTTRHVRNAQNAAEKLGEVELPPDEVSE